jgi:hypothetical protein
MSGLKVATAPNAVSAYETFPIPAARHIRQIELVLVNPTKEPFKHLLSLSRLSHGFSAATIS